MSDEKIIDLESRFRISGFCRKENPEKTDECPIWDEWSAVWIESDKQLRDRIKNIMTKENDSK